MKGHKTQLTIKFYEEDLYNDMDLIDLLHVGNKVIVYDNTHDLTGDQSFGLMADNGEGIPALLNPLNLEYHGWRGTYCNVSQHGHGLRNIEKIIHTKDRDGNVIIKVVLGPDLVPDKP